jgi:hypothetical protein
MTDLFRPDPSDDRRVLVSLDLGQVLTLAAYHEGMARWCETNGSAIQWAFERRQADIMLAASIYLRLSPEQRGDLPDASSSPFQAEFWRSLIKDAKDTGEPGNYRGLA